MLTRRTIIGSAVSAIALAGAATPGEISVAECGVEPGTRKDWTAGVRAALAELRRHKASRLVFPKGRYDFWPDRASERPLYISNNDRGLKRIAFPLFGIEGLTIDGQGSDFVFHGQTLPFVLDAARNVTLADFSIA